MATYIDANNCICHDGNWERQDDSDNQRVKYIRNTIPMTKSEINTTLKISRQSFSPFWNEKINN